MPLYAIHLVAVGRDSEKPISASLVANYDHLQEVRALLVERDWIYEEPLNRFFTELEDLLEKESEQR